MILRNEQKMFDAEIIIAVVIKLNNDGNVENKEALQKCPHCRTGIGNVFYRGPERKDERSENLGFVCAHCGKRWHLRFKYPVLYFKI